MQKLKQKKNQTNKADLSKLRDQSDACCLFSSVGATYYFLIRYSVHIEVRRRRRRAERA